MLSVDKRKKQYDISGSVPATFEIDFPYWAKSQIGAILTTPDGDVPLTQDVDYSLSDPGDTGTLTRIGTWDATATRLTIYRDLDIIQTILDLTNGGELDADALELALDEVVAMIQQVREELGRVVRFPITEAESSPDMPSAEERALNFLAFDVDGSPIASPGSAGEYPVSDLMGPVLAATSLLSAQIGLGLLPSGASAAISTAMKTFLAAATVLDMQKAAGIVPSGASAAISSAMQGVLASPGSGWTDALAQDATKLAAAMTAGIGTGWDTALAANASDLAAALAAGKGWLPVGAVYFRGPHDSAPSALYYGTWADVSYEEADLGRRVVGNMAGAMFGGTPARLSVSVAAGVPSISIVSGGTGYLSGGSGSINLIIAGACTTQMIANATVTAGVLTAINVTQAGAGYTSGALQVYDGVVGRGDLVQRHVHESGHQRVGTFVGGSTRTKGDFSSATSGACSLTDYPISDGANGTHRSGAETSGPWIAVTKYRRTE